MWIIFTGHFSWQDNSCYLVAMASSGYIYTQVLSEESSAQHGPFYVTNVLQVHHQDLKVCFYLSCGKWKLLRLLYSYNFLTTVDATYALKAKSIYISLMQ